MTLLNQYGSPIRATDAGAPYSGREPRGPRMVNARSGQGTHVDKSLGAGLR